MRNTSVAYRSLVATANLLAFTLSVPSSFGVEYRAARQVRTQTVVAGAEYENAPGGRWLLGDDYRDLWATPIDVEVLELQTVGGGLSPVRRVGGNQTLGLALTGKDVSGELVGFDIEMANRLADRLGVELELVPIDRLKLADQLDGTYCDLVMASLVITTQRAREVLFADSHLDETFAFVVPDHRRAEFSSIEKVRRIVPLRVAAPDLPGVFDLVEGMVPDAEVTTFKSIDAIFSAANEFDAIVLTAERGSAWSLLHPEMSVVVPQPDPPRMPLAYSIAAHDERLRDFVNVWLELEAKGGTIGKLYSYWILGRDAEPRTPRWSVIRDVLHWVE